MAEYSKQERQRYNEHRERVGKEYGLEKKHYNALRRVANSYSEADTNYANGTNRMGERYEEKHYKKDVKSTEHKLKALKKAMGGKWHSYHQSDPRGASLYIGKKKLKSENYNSEGHHIY